MGLLQMSFSGAVLILAVILIRALAMNYLPKKTFLILWGIVIFRLLVPFAVPSAFSVYSLIGQNEIFGTQAMTGHTDSAKSAAQPTNGIFGTGHTNSAESAAQPPNEILGAQTAARYANSAESAAQPSDRIFGTGHTNSAESATQPSNGKIGITMETHGTIQQTGGVDIGTVSANSRQQPDNTVLLKDSDNCKTDTTVIFNHLIFHKTVIWCIGMLLCTAYFAITYLRCRFEFQTSLPVENAFTAVWLEKHACKRTISVRQSDRISSPLTYGVFRPVILMPKSTDWGNAEQLEYVLLHEYVHIVRCDALAKLIATAALCIHWFNPMVWIMYALFNRDVEISCDESVVRRLGDMSKSAYARVLIQMEAQRSGFMPLYNSFFGKIGKNAMEERITAIMKIKRKSLLAAAAAAVLVVSVTAVFATTAAEKKENTAAISDTDLTNADLTNTDLTNADLTDTDLTSADLTNTDFTEQDYAMLFALAFDGYEDMSISAYRDKVHKMTDTKAYKALLEQFFQNEALYAWYEGKEGAGNITAEDKKAALFLYNVLSPLTTEKQQFAFGGYAVTDYPSASDNAILEYFATLTVRDAEQVTVGEYSLTREHVVGALENNFTALLNDMTTNELRDTETMRVFIDEEVENIAYKDDRLEIAVEYVYTPLGATALDDMEEWQKERKKDWDKILAQYTPFGLTYRYDWDTDDYKMYFQGKEVRGIFDEKENVWISEHSGTGKGIYEENAVELYAVYEHGQLAGLREATAQEQKEWSELRQAASGTYFQDNAQEVRQYAPATEEDYQSLLALKTPDYPLKSVADFNRELLEWANEDYERMERIGCDRGWNDYHAALTDEEKSFVSLTTWLSGMENGEYVTSLHKDEPEGAIQPAVELPAKEAAAENRYGYTACSLYYTFSYYITDKEKTSVGERDRWIGGMLDSIRGYWESTEIEQLLEMSREEMLELLHSIAAKYSSRYVTITIVDDATGFERIDERMPDNAPRENAENEVVR